MKTLRQLIAGKHKPIATVDPDSTVLHALEIMAENDVGALLVLDGGRLAGVFSERDYARKVILRGRNSRDTVIRELMTSNLITITPEQTITDCMSIMTDRHIRHLPVMDGGKVVGLVSIGDVVKSIISDQEATIQQLAGYISGDLKT